MRGSSLGLSNAPFLVIKESKESLERVKTVFGFLSQTIQALFVRFFCRLPQPSSLSYSGTYTTPFVPFFGMSWYWFLSHCFLWRLEKIFRARCGSSVGLSTAHFLVIKESKESHERVKTVFGFLSQTIPALFVRFFCRLPQPSSLSYSGTYTTPFVPFFGMSWYWFLSHCFLWRLEKIFRARCGSSVGLSTAHFLVIKKTKESWTRLKSFWVSCCANPPIFVCVFLVAPTPLLALFPFCGTSPTLFFRFQSERFWLPFSLWRIELPSC